MALKRPRLVIIQTVAGFHVVLQTRNGEPLMSSELLETSAAAENNARAAMSNAPLAVIEWRRLKKT